LVCDGAVAQAVVSACRFAAGVWKKVDAERFFWVELGGWLWGLLVCVPFGGEDDAGSLVSSRRKAWQPESMWSLISEALTPRLQMGHTTISGLSLGEESPGSVEKGARDMMLAGHGKSGS
jgi:hypothetical protein